MTGIPSVVIAHSTRESNESGAVLHAVRNCVVTPLTYRSRLIGCCIQRDYGGELYLMDVHGAGQGDVFAQTRGTFAVIDDVLDQNGFAAGDVVRCWNYLESIAASYACFNRARDEYFLNRGVTSYPAATGIEARLPGSRLVTLCIEAMRPRGGMADVRVVASDLQGEAVAYGPKFSRGATVEVDCGNRSVRKIYISGTSHIDGNGKSVISKDTTKDVTCTMSAVRHLLLKSDSDLDDIAWSIVYCKDVDVYQSFRSVYDSHGWDFPYLPVFVNICRPELTFEIECFAAAAMAARGNLERQLCSQENP